jgi:hypothetical protein
MTDTWLRELARLLVAAQRDMKKPSPVGEMTGRGRRTGDAVAVTCSAREAEPVSVRGDRVALA